MQPYLRVANVFEDRIDTTDLKEMDFSGVFEKFKLHPGDVLLNEGQTPELLGRPAIYRGTPEQVAFTNSLIRFKAGRDVTPEWALIVFRHHMHSGRFTRESRITTNIAHLSMTRFKTVEFPVPSLAEQRRIVEILEDHLSRLDAADAYLYSSELRLMGFRRAALARHFSDSHQTVGLAAFVSRVEAGRSFGAASAPAGPGEWGIVKVSAMTWGEFRSEENKAVPADKADSRYEIRSGDLLVSRANTSDYVGASVLVGDVRSRLLLSDKSLRLVCRPGVRTEWLWRALQSPIARKQISSLATGTKDSMRNISQKALLSVQLPALSLESQDEALHAYSEATSQIGPLELSIANARLRCKSTRRALLAAAFSGKLTGRHTGQEMIEPVVANEQAVVGAG